MTETNHNAKAKPSWPLFVLAGTAFIPILGILLGAIGLTWGLLSSRPHAIRAGIIAGAGAMVNIVALFAIAFFMGAGNSEFTSLAERTIAQQDLVKIVGALEEYRKESGVYPGSLSELQRRPAVLRTLNIFDRTAGVLNPRVYEYEPSRDGATYDLYSVGADGERGTEDDIRPELPDSLAATAGYRPSTPDEDR